MSISSLCYRFLTGMTVHSLPRLIRLCRGNREACFANKPALITRTGYLPVPLSLNCNRLALVRSVTRWLTSWLTGCLLQVTTSRFKRLKAVLTGELSALQNAFVTRDDYHRTFAVFTLEPSLKTGGTPPIPNAYIPPLMPCGTQYHVVECGPPYGALSGRWGLAQ